MQTKRIALARGDGAAPEMMAVATRLAITAAQKDDIKIGFVDTPITAIDGALKKLVRFIAKFIAKGAYSLHPLFDDVH